ncbi:hypothetical protein AX16_001351 [Volvariella volvacea WC 439]|nr:hypothetical protein AX16_001351 [Volvariella volvacea WC 439]
MSSTALFSTTLSPTDTTESANAHPDSKEANTAGTIILAIFFSFFIVIGAASGWARWAEGRRRRGQKPQTPVLASTTSLGPDLEQAREGDDMSEKADYYPADLKTPVPMIRRPSSTICAGEVGSRRETTVRRNVSR